MVDPKQANKTLLPKAILLVMKDSNGMVLTQSGMEKKQKRL